MVGRRQLEGLFGGGRGRFQPGILRGSWRRDYLHPTGSVLRDAAAHFPPESRGELSGRRCCARGSIRSSGLAWAKSLVVGRRQRRQLGGLFLGG